MKRIIFFTLTLLVIIFCTAHNNVKADNSNEANAGKIIGKVVDASTNQPMEYANIVLYNQVDSSLVTGTITDNEGNFSLEKVPAGQYYVEINFMGFDKQVINNIKIDKKKKGAILGNIILKPATNNLAEVNVKADRNLVEYKLDKKIVNVEQNIAAKGGTAAKALENAPSVQTDSNGDITLRGSSDFTVLVNGKPSVLKGNDALKQLPADNIKQIEIITNPSAKYEADGKAGIINVILKKNNNEGFNGTIGTSLGTGGKYSGNALFNYSIGKINFFAGVDYSDNSNLVDLDIKEALIDDGKTKYTNTEAAISDMRDQLIFKGGFDYNINDKNYMSLSGEIGHKGFDNEFESKYHQYTDTENTGNYGESNTYKDIYGDVTSLNADYTHTFAENHDLSANITGSIWDGYVGDDVNVYQTDNNWNNEIKINTIKTWRRDYNYNISSKIDYKRPLGEKGRLETGYKLRYDRRFDDHKYNYDTDANKYSNLTELRYNRQIHAGYIMYANQFKGFEYQVGLRMEYTDRKVFVENTDEEYKYTEDNWFPSLHISKGFEDKSQIQLSYSRRINRPDPWSLNTFPTYIDVQNIFVGSPDINPEFANSFEFSYRKSFEKISFSAQTYYRQTLNPFEQTRTPNPETGITIHKLQNADENSSYGLELSGNYTPFKWWQISSGVNIYHYKIEGSIGQNDVENENNTWDARLMSNFTLKWGTRIQAMGYYSATSVDLNGEREALYVVNLSINQELMKGKASIGLSAQKLFNSVNFKYKTSDYNYNKDYQIMVEGPVFMINFSYRFNNYKQKQRGSSDGENGGQGGGLF